MAGAPLPALAPDAVAVAREIGSPARTARSAQHCPLLHRHLSRAVARANRRAASRAHRVRRWILLPSSLSQAGGELTPTLKVRRAAVAERYARGVDALYALGRHPHSGVGAGGGGGEEEEEVEGVSWDELVGDGVRDGGGVGAGGGAPLGGESAPGEGAPSPSLAERVVTAGRQATAALLSGTASGYSRVYAEAKEV